MELTLEHRIRERAYFLSLAGGGAGDGVNFWLIAEREVLAEVAMEFCGNLPARGSDPVGGNGEADGRPAGDGNCAAASSGAAEEDRTQAASRRQGLGEDVRQGDRSCRRGKPGRHGEAPIACRHNEGHHVTGTPPSAPSNFRVPLSQLTALPLPRALVGLRPTGRSS